MKKLLLPLWQPLWRIRTMCRTMSLGEAVRLVLAEGKDREMRIHLPPSGYEAVLRCGTSDIACMEKVFVKKEYESPFPLDPRIIVDAGANIGMATLYYAQEYPKAKIIAIEPERSNFKVLQENCARLPNVVLVEGALWGEDSNLVIQDACAEKWGFSVAESRSPSSPRTQEVKAVTIPGLLRDLGIQRIDLLKVDIEGAECELFKAAPESWLGAVSQIVIELHDRFHPGCARAFYAALVGRPFAQEIRGENTFIKLAD